MILLLLSCILSLVYLFDILFLYKGLKKLIPRNEEHALTFSVVIAARNEEANIGMCLDNLLTQTIGNSRYQVIVVNDRSTDNTENIIRNYTEKYPFISSINIDSTPQGISPKKHAMIQGIARAEHEIIVFTDADCIVPHTWLDTIGKQFGKDTGLVQGITVFKKVDEIGETFFGLQAVDFLSHGIVAASAIGAGMPINSNANNFSVRKETFEHVGGYGDKSGVVSGDDDLLLQRVWKSGIWKVRYMADASGAVQTLPTLTIKGVFEQRKRWGSKTVHYNSKQVVFLSGIFLFYLMILVSLVSCFIIPQAIIAALMMISVKVAGESLLMIPGTSLFNQKTLRKFIIPASIIQLPMVLAAVFMGVFGKFVWKDQRFARQVK